MPSKEELKRLTEECRVWSNEKRSDIANPQADPRIRLINLVIESEVEPEDIGQGEETLARWFREACSLYNRSRNLS